MKNVCLFRRGALVRCGLSLLLMAGGVGCALRGQNTISDQTFAGLYPDGYATVEDARKLSRNAQSLVAEAKSAWRSAAFLQQALSKRFDALEETFKFAEAWGKASLSEHWPTETMQASLACLELKGPMTFLEKSAARAMDQLLDWRKAVWAEADALWALRKIEVEQEKITPFFQMVPAGPELNPDQMRSHWQSQYQELHTQWHAAREQSAQQKAAFEQSFIDFESYRKSIPQNTECPVYLIHDPLFSGFSWTERTVQLPQTLEEAQLVAPLP